MKKWYSMALLLLVLVLAATMVVACGDEEETTTTAAPVTTAAPETTAPPTSAAPTETTAAPGGDEVGIFFEDLGNNVVKITDVPAPGMAFPVTTSGDMAATIEAFDASGASLGNLETETGDLDYSSVADTVAKIVVTGPTGTVSEYEVPAGAAGDAAEGGDEVGIFFEDLGNNVVKITDVPAPGMAFPVTTSGDMAATIEAFDASGASLGNLETETGDLDYSSVADTVAKIVVTGPTGTVSEYMVP